MTPNPKGQTMTYTVSPDQFRNLPIGASFRFVGPSSMGTTYRKTSGCTFTGPNSDVRHTAWVDSSVAVAS